MRILALTNLYPNVFQETKAPFVRNELLGLSHSHTVRVISPISWMDELRGCLRGIRLTCRSTTRDNIPIDYPRYWYPPGLLRQYYGQLFYQCARRVFHQVATSLQPHLVYTPWAYPDGWAAVRLAREIGVPVVIKVHGSDILLLNQHQAKLIPTTSAVRQADGIVAVSRDLTTRLTQLGVPPNKLYVNYGGVDQSTFFPGSRALAREKLGLPATRRVLLFIGNLVAVKDIPCLLTACTHLRKRRDDFELRIIGGGPLRSELQRLCRQHELTDTVYFEGTMPQSQLGDWFRAADLFVLSSKSEGVPSVLLEAASCGTPFVAPRVGGIPEIVEWGRGVLVKPGDPSDLARGIEKGLEQVWPGEERILQRSAQDSAWELEQIFEQVLAQHSAQPSALSDTQSATHGILSFARGLGALLSTQTASETLG
jgi:glycosyltransferase involved in cell wall biosynthesis